MLLEVGKKTTTRIEWATLYYNSEYMPTLPECDYE